MTPTQREDYISRQIRAIAAMLARIAGLRLEGQLEEAGSELEQAYGLLLGLEGGSLRRVDAGTAATILSSPERILAFASLLNEEASQERDAARGGSLRKQALAVGIEAARRDRQNEAVGIFLAGLAPLVDRGDLAPADRSLFEEILKSRSGAAG